MFDSGLDADFEDVVGEPLVPASEAAAYSVLEAPIGDFQVLLAVVSITEGTVRVAVPESALELLEDNGLPVDMSAEVLVAVVSNRARATTSRLRVGFLDLALADTKQYAAAVLQKEVDPARYVFGQRDG